MHDRSGTKDRNRAFFGRVRTAAKTNVGGNKDHRNDFPSTHSSRYAFQKHDSHCHNPSHKRGSHYHPSHKRRFHYSPTHKCAPKHDCSRKHTRGCNHDSTVHSETNHTTSIRTSRRTTREANTPHDGHVHITLHGMVP